ncbi:MAG: hypothetical protein ACOX7P_06250 [Oscillospiraceae bacterium]
MLKYSSMEAYIDKVRTDTNLGIQPTKIIPPIGPAADRYLWNAISECCMFSDHIISFTAPCIRRERKENIQLGSHLSLFFLMMIVMGNNVQQFRRDQIYSAITDVTGIGLNEILSNDCKEFYCDNFTFRQKHVASAKNFDCTGYAYEMFDKKEIEICNIARFTMKNSEQSCYVMAFGIERMLMHLEKQTNVWNTTAFISSSHCQQSLFLCDKQRRLAFKAYADKPAEQRELLNEYRANVII